LGVDPSRGLSSHSLPLAHRNLIVPNRLTFGVGTALLVWGCCLTLVGCSPPESIHQVRVPAELSERRVSATPSPSQTGNAPEQESSGPKYKTPEGWTVGGPRTMRLATLEVADGDQKCDISLSQLAAGQSVLDNVNRWRKQVKLAEVAEADLQLKPIKSGGFDGSLVVATGETETILAVIIPRPDTTYFVKLQGPNALALREMEKFVQFTESIEWK
jgi:hypothetical protein